MADVGVDTNLTNQPGRPVQAGQPGGGGGERREPDTQQPQQDTDMFNPGDKTDGPADGPDGPGGQQLDTDMFNPRDQTDGDTQASQSESQPGDDLDALEGLRPDPGARCGPRDY